MFFDPDGRHLRTKKEATVDDELMPGYTMIPKGEVYEQHLFSKKNPLFKLFKQKDFTEQAKEFFTDLINEHLREDLRLQMFPMNSPYLATKKIGKNNPKAEEIRADNKLRRQWNDQVDRAARRGVPRESNMTVKHELLTKPAAESIKRSGNDNPSRFRKILTRAVLILTRMLKELEHVDRETWCRAWGDALMKFMDYCAEKDSGQMVIAEKNKHMTR